MKGFIEVSLGKDKVILAASHIWSIGTEANGKTGIYLAETGIQNHLETDESLTEVIAKIEAAQGETRGISDCPYIDKDGNCSKLSDKTVKQPCIEGPCEWTSNPRVNVYYRTADRLPTKEDADREEYYFVSYDGQSWCVRDDVDGYDYWSPVPKVEAKS